MKHHFEFRMYPLVYFKSTDNGIFSALGSTFANAGSHIVKESDIPLDHPVYFVPCSGIQKIAVSGIIP